MGRAEEVLSIGVNNDCVSIKSTLIQSFGDQIDGDYLNLDLVDMK